MDEFIFRALLGGILVALFSAPLGCLMIWQKMAYFGAALSHAALLGVALGFFIDLNLQLAILLVSMLVVVLTLFMQRFRALGNDTILGIVAHSSLAFGLIALSLMPTLRIDLMGYLFGDILTVNWRDIGVIGAGAIVILITLANIWKPLLSTIINADLAMVDGHNLARLQLLFLMLLSIAVAVSMQVVGVLLIVSLLIMPAAIARRMAKSPEQMVILAAIAGALSVLIGMAMSLTFDTPTGPSIVASSSILLALGLITTINKKQA